MYKNLLVLLLAGSTLTLSSQEILNEPIYRNRENDPLVSAGAKFLPLKGEEPLATSRIKISCAPEEAPPLDKVEELCSHIQVGLSYTWVQITPDDLTSLTGNLGGVQGRYEFQTPGRIYGAITIDWREGKTDGGGTKRTLTYIDTQERIGYTFDTKADWLCSIFTGVGYRHNGEDVTVGADTTAFNYDEIYIPVGLLVQGPYNDTLSVGLNFWWMPQVYPNVEIDPLKGARWILTSEIANFYLGLPLLFTLSKKYECFLAVEPFFEYWKDGHTTAVTEQGVHLDVPSNTYLFAGVHVNIGHSF